MSENKGPTTQIVGVEMPTRIQTDISLDATKALEVSLQAVKDGLGGEAGKALDRSLAQYFELFGEAPGLLLKFSRLIEGSLRRIKGPPQAPPYALLSTTIDAVKHQPPGLLYEMFAELLARGMDRERESEAHPAFVEIIKGLSADEAVILKTAWDNKVIDEYAIYTVGVDAYPSSQATERTSRVKSGEHSYEEAASSFGKRQNSLFGVSYNFISPLSHSHYANMYLRRLTHMGLLEEIFLYGSNLNEFEHTGEAIMDNVIALHTHCGWSLSAWGQMFVEACLPPEWQW